MSEDNIAAARRIFDEAWNQGNLDVIDEVCAESFVDHDPIGGDRDLETAKGAIADYRAAFPDLELTIDEIFAGDDKVVTRWTANGTFENEFMGQEPTHERGAPIQGIAIDRFEDGKIVESWGQWQVLTFMQNIGLVPSQEAVEAPVEEPATA